MNEAEQLVMEAIKNRIKRVEQLHALKNAYAVKFGRSLFSNVELLDAYKGMIARGELVVDRVFWNLLRKRGVRSKSGIVSITVLTKNFPCPGACIYCPSEPAMPKSYLSNEPAVMRAILSDFDPFRQIMNRLRSLESAGHHTEKIEVIVSGGTFSFYPANYRTGFVRSIYNALNSPKPAERSLSGAQKANETAVHRCIGLSLETRPDFIDVAEVKELRKMGATKIELGVQSLNDEVLKMNRRGHTTQETISAIRLLKDAAFKVNCHMMPNLYGSSVENDYRDFSELFNNPDYRPDWLKIYPCMVVPWSKLEKIYTNGLYKPYSDEELIELLIRIKLIVPEYVRITRMYRDIPAQTIVAGSKMSNIRQIIQELMKNRDLKCKCIRCREIKDEDINYQDLELKIDDFEASKGREFFVSYNQRSGDRLCSLLRLRFSSFSLSGKRHFMRELEGAALIREVHTYGEQQRIGKKEGATQHIGLGKSMIKAAEDISKKNGFKKIAVISGVGVREYYRKLGYELDGTYMVKRL